MTELTKNTLVLIDIRNSTPVAYFDVYEDGDRWDKIKGCDSCPEDMKAKCCGSCYHLQEGATCKWQNLVDTRGGISMKSLFCMIYPTPEPDEMHSPCSLQYKCVKGSEKILGKIRRVSDKRGVLV